LRRYLLASLLLFSSFMVSAAITFEQLVIVSATPDYLKGGFRQEKYLQALDASLISTGQFEYRRNKFIRWQTLQPIQSELTMTPTSIVSQQAGQALLALDSETNPAVAVLSDILFSVLTAEWGKLSAYFELQGEFEGSELEGRKWHAMLQPSDQSVAQFVEQVELRGDSLLRTIVLFEKGGDRTEIHFENMSQ
jgi:hypothetical protein